MAAGRPAMFPLFRQNGLAWRQWPARLSPKSSPGRSRRAYDQEALFIFLGAHDTSAEKTTCACGRAVSGTGTVVGGWVCMRAHRGAAEKPVQLVLKFVEARYKELVSVGEQQCGVRMQRGPADGQVPQPCVYEVDRVPHLVRLRRGVRWQMQQNIVASSLSLWRTRSKPCGSQPTTVTGAPAKAAVRRKAHNHGPGRLE